MRKNRLLLLFLFLFMVSCSRCEEDPLVDVFGQPCMIDSDKEDGFFLVDKETEEYINVGICRTGKVEKDETGKKVCVGQINAREEICNGLDDNCDGEIDPSWEVDRSFWNSKNDCSREALGVCRYTDQVCVEGQYICVYPDSYGTEKCDSLDNDCDGEVDEDTEEDPIFSEGERYVYTGNPDTINVGECRAGYKECVYGQVNIRNMRTPVTEICGNGDDDDCDGLTDENETENESADYLLIVDYSGSMSLTINSVAQALCEWSTQGVLQTSRFAVVAIGFSDGSSSLEIKKLTDFTDSNTACNVLRVNNNLNNSGGLEYTLDAIYKSSESSSGIYVNWTNTNKKVIVFTDEEMQESMFLSIQDGLNMISQQCIEQNYSISAFINFNVSNQSEWVDLTQNCGGFLDYLSHDPQIMIDSLNYWIGTDC